MFCYQCEQTAKSTACTVKGVCGKKDEVATLQDLLVYALKGLALTVREARGKVDIEADVYRFLEEGLFTTLTNVNFDPEALAEWIGKAVEHRKALAVEADVVLDDPVAVFEPATDIDGLIAQGREVGINQEASDDPDVRALQHTLLFGLKGVSAYADHAHILGYRDEAVETFLVDALADLAHYGEGDLGYWLERVLGCGEANLKAMEILDRGNTETFGHPTPTPVPLGAKAGKAILVSGHDLLDLEALLEQTKDLGINVYTHGEMLPAHGYPKLKAYPHFYGNYGTAWQNQKREFVAFPGAILMTTNCLMEPQPEYEHNVFITGAVGWPGLPRVERDDFSAVIARALELPGFAADTPGKTVTVGFGRDAILSHAGAIVDLVKQGKIKHFLLVGGCDGAKPGRNYYTEFVEKAPADTVVLTLACGKYRFYDKDLGDIEGIPRLLDVGQCNDAYSAVQVALALADAFDVGVNELPLSMVLSWYEQKAVAILLSLLYLGIKDMRLGPTLPAFLTPNVVQYLIDNYDIKPITTPDEDLAAILA
jgi:hydroxylamine reductase